MIKNTVKKSDYSFSCISQKEINSALENNKIFEKLLKVNHMFFEKILTFEKNRKFYPLEIEKEDMFQEMMISFLKALKKYNSEKNIKFSTFAFKVIKNDIMLIRKKNQNEIKKRIRNSYINWNSTDENFFDYISNPSPGFEKDTLNTISNIEIEKFTKNLIFNIDKIENKNIRNFLKDNLK